MSQFIETVEDVERQLDEALGKLSKFEEDISNEQAWDRLQTEAPSHPIILMRLLFAGLGFSALFISAGLFAIPFVGPMLTVQQRRDIPLDEIKSIEVALGFPLPVAFGAIALCLIFGYFMLGFAAISIGRDMPMLGWEAKQHADLADLVKRLTAQRNTILRNAGTPAGSRNRMQAPNGAAPMGGGGGGAPADAGPLVSFGGDGPPGGGGGPLVSFGGDSPGPSRQWDDQPTAPHYAVNSGGGGGSGFVQDGGSGFVQDGGGGFVQDGGSGLVSGGPPSGVGGVGGVGGGLVGGASSGFETRRSTVIPKWGPAEPWLKDVLGRAEQLANTFPIQARLEFNREQDLPFMLVLERATPAMAVRAMMSYVEFLANIPTPRKGLVTLGSNQVDRGFYRNVMSAVEPYFPDTVELVKGTHDVELNFLQPDARWGRYPMLPVE